MTLDPYAQVGLNQDAGLRGGEGPLKNVFLFFWGGVILNDRHFGELSPDGNSTCSTCNGLDINKDVNEHFQSGLKPPA